MKRLGEEARCTGYDTKRARAENNQEYKRLKGVHLPSAIVALPHVMEQIDTLLMPYEEAVEEAIRTRDYQWFRQLRSGTKDKIVYDAILSAGDGDYDATVDLLEDLADLEVYGNENHTNEWRVLEEAAANGHLDIFKYIAEGLWDGVDREEWGYEQEAHDGKPEALLRAISGGHTGVVDTLLDPSEFSWDLAEAPEYALDHGQTGIAETNYKSFFSFHDVAQRCVENRGYIFGPYGDLLVQVACRARVDTVSMCSTNNTTDVIECAFQHAAEREWLEVVGVFFKTGRVSLKTVETAFFDAARSGLIKTVTLLYRHFTPSSQLIKKALEYAGSASAVRYLAKKEFIPTALLIKVLEAHAAMDRVRS